MFTTFKVVKMTKELERISSFSWRSCSIVVSLHQGTAVEGDCVLFDAFTQTTLHLV